MQREEQQTDRLSSSLMSRCLAFSGSHQPPAYADATGLLGSAASSAALTPHSPHDGTAPVINLVKEAALLHHSHSNPTADFEHNWGVARSGQRLRSLDELPWGAWRLLQGAAAQTECGELGSAASTARGSNQHR